MKRQVGRVSEGEKVRACSNISSMPEVFNYSSHGYVHGYDEVLNQRVCGGSPLSGAGGSGG